VLRIPSRPPQLPHIFVDDTKTLRSSLALFQGTAQVGVAAGGVVVAVRVGVIVGVMVGVGVGVLVGGA
jgi:hypothetical protein